MKSQMLIPLSDHSELNRYLKEIEQFPFLTPEEEFQFAVRFHENQDREAAHRLVRSYLRYVVKIAREYQNYGLRMMDMVQEGSIGLMQAVKKFNPYKGFRLSTYAVWWIRAAIQEFVLRSWSLVRIGTTAAQRKLFFNLRKNKRSIEQLDEQEAHTLGKTLDVSTKDVMAMDVRMSGPDESLNRLAVDSGEEVQNLLTDPRPNQETHLMETEAGMLRRQTADVAMNALNERERTIIRWRILSETPLTLESIGQKLSVSRERVRQLEKQAIKKMRAALEQGKTPALSPAGA